MIDIKLLHNKYREIKRNLLKRGYEIDKNIIRKYLEIKKIKTEIDQINARLNRNTGLVDDKLNLKELKENIIKLENEFNVIVDMIPNILHETVPLGKDATDNKIIKVIEKDCNNTCGYMEIAEANGLNIKAGVDLAGARFNVMNGNVAKLHRKLLNMALNDYEAHGYEYHYVPNLVTKETMYGTGQYPKFKDDLFETTTGLYLIPTGEVPLTNLVANQIINEDVAERKMVTNTPCFRKEVGAYGKDTKGIIRQHQFEKVELVRICLPENGLNTFNEMVNDIEMFVKGLGIKYRIIELCAGDIGFAGHKANDIEVWFPKEKVWREIATITWCHDFQARRMNARVKRKDGKKEYLHTLNGTGLAVGRVLACLIEQYGENVFNILN